MIIKTNVIFKYLTFLSLFTISLSTTYFSYKDKLNVIGYYGNNRRIMKFEITQSLPYSVLSSKNVNLTQSPNSKFLSNEDVISKDSQLISAKEVKDSVSLNTKQLNTFDFHYYLTNDLTSNILSLAYSFKKEEFNFLKYLKENGSIDKMTYTFIAKDLNEGNIYFGTFPQNNLQKDTKEGICNVDGKSFLWNCHVKYFYFPYNEVNSNNLFVYMKQAYFKLEEEKIFLPQKIMNYITESYYKNKCIVLIKNNIETLYCDQLNDRNVKDDYFLVIIFDSFKIIFNFRDLFKCDEKKCVSLFAHNHKNNDLIFGRTLTNYPTEAITFDYDNKNIHIIREYGRESRKEKLNIKNKSKNKMNILLMNIIILLVMCNLIFLWKINKS